MSEQNDHLPDYFHPESHLLHIQWEIEYPAAFNIDINDLSNRISLQTHSSYRNLLLALFIVRVFWRSPPSHHHHLGSHIIVRTFPLLYALNTSLTRLSDGRYELRCFENSITTTVLFKRILEARYNGDGSVSTTQHLLHPVCTSHHFLLSNSVDLYCPRFQSHPHTSTRQ